MNKNINKGITANRYNRNELLPENKSIVFISFHKCATSLFSNYVLLNTKNLVQIDYQKLFYLDKIVKKISYEPRGYVYGVIRVLEKSHPLFPQTNFLLNKKNLNDKKLIFLIRDPRDILVSMYYSFGSTHGFSANEQIMKFQEQRQNKIRKMAIDEYVIEEALTLRSKFEIINFLRKNVKNHILLKYEDMIENYGSFYRELNEFMPLKEELELRLFERTRPHKEEQIVDHKRSGKVGGYKRKLKKGTIRKVNNILKNTLLNFNYTLINE